MPDRIPTYRPQAKPSTKKERNRQFKRERTDRDTNDFYSSRGWRKTRAAFLTEHPLCMDCLAEGRDEPATRADHQVEIKDDMTRAFDFDNLRALCESHHNAKTRRKQNEARHG